MNCHDHYPDQPDQPCHICALSAARERADRATRVAYELEAQLTVIRGNVWLRNVSPETLVWAEEHRGADQAHAEQEKARLEHPLEPDQIEVATFGSLLTEPGEVEQEHERDLREHRLLDSIMLHGARSRAALKCARMLLRPDMLKILGLDEEND